MSAPACEIRAAPGPRPTEPPPLQRLLRRGAYVSIAAGAAVAAALVLAPGLRGVARLVGHASAPWLLVAAVFEAGSCLGFVAVVRGLFAELPARVARRLGWAELAANVLVPAGGVSGLGLGAWILRRRGRSTTGLVQRSAAMFVLTSVPNFVAVAVVGPAMWLGILPGPRAWSLTLVPALGAAAVLIAGVVLTRRRMPARLAGRRWAAPARLAGSAIREARTHVRWRDRGLWGSIAYWACDNAVLAVGLWSVGNHAAAGTILMAYLLGQLASLLPVPGGLGAAEGGLIGALVVFGVALAPAAAAVLLYRAVALWIPMVGGLVAFAALRRDPALA